MNYLEMKISESKDEDDLDFYDYDFDIAISHMCNADLRLRDKVQTFFKDIRHLESLDDSFTRRWLSKLPLDMYDEAVPLFDEDASTGYQLHPCFTNIALSDTARNPHPDIFWLPIRAIRATSTKLDSPQLFMGIGRLFVNTDCGPKGYLSKWTGYEVFVDHELGLWMVFDMQSKVHDHDGWYEFSCKLVESQGQTREPTFDCAKFCDSLSELSSASFDKALTLVDETHASGTITIRQEEKEEVRKFIRIGSALSDAVSGDAFGWHRFLNEYRQETRDMNVPKRVYFRAAANEIAGQVIFASLVTILADDGDVSFYRGSVARAAGNQECGEDILGILAEHNSKAFMEAISREAVTNAATNGRGKLILEILFSGNEDAVLEYITSILHKESEDDEGEVVQRLKEHVMEIPFIRSRVIKDD